ncbi:hypothetical protein Tco_1136250 [Tanacetum coccineum]
MIALVKVRWDSKRGPELTWERKDRMRLSVKFCEALLDSLWGKQKHQVAVAHGLDHTTPWGKTGGYDQISNKDALILYFLENGVNIDISKLIWDDLLLKLQKRNREKVVPYTSFLSLLLEHKMNDIYVNDEATSFQTSISNVNNWPLKKDQPEGPPFTAHMLDICNDDGPTLQATSGPNSLGVTSEVRSGPQLISVVSASSTKHVFSASTIIHSESASGHDASTDSTTEANLGKSNPKDSLSQQQGNDEGTTNFSYDHFIAGANPSVLVDKTKSVGDSLGTIQPNTKTKKAPKTEQEFDTSLEFNTSSTAADDEEIKLEDLSKLVKDIDTLVSPPPSPKSIQIQELTNRVLLLQSQKCKLEKAHVAAQAKATLSKAQPAFLNVKQLTKLLVTSLKPELLKLLTDHNFSSSIPTELKELPSKINDIDGVVGEIKKYVEELEVEVPVLTSKVVALEKIKLDLPARLLALPKQISSINVQLSKLKVLDALPSLLNKVIEALDRFATAIESASQKAGEINIQRMDMKKMLPKKTLSFLLQALLKTTLETKGSSQRLRVRKKKQKTLSHEEVTEEESRSDSDDEIKLSVDVAKSKIKKGMQNLIDLVGLKVVEKMYRVKVKYNKYYLKMLNQRALGKIINYDVLSRGKGPIPLKVYRDDGSDEIIQNFKASNLHLGEWKEVMDASPIRTGAGWTTINAQMRKRLDALHKAKAELELDLSKPLEEHDPIIKLNLLCNTPKMGRSGI